jgi:hypothetical protein
MLAPKSIPAVEIDQTWWELFGRFDYTWKTREEYFLCRHEHANTRNRRYGLIRLLGLYHY